MSNYNNNFTLFDIFGNRRLRTKLPMIDIVFSQKGTGFSWETSTRNMERQVYSVAVSAAKPLYNPLKATHGGSKVVLDGSSELSLTDIQNAVYDTINAQKTMLVWTANNITMIDDAMKSAENDKYFFGNDAKVYLRASSMQEIEGMSNTQLQALMNDIMDNIYYNDTYAVTQEKYGLKNAIADSPFDYNQRKQAWQRKVGII